MNRRSAQLAMIGLSVLLGACAGTASLQPPTTSPVTPTPATVASSTTTPSPTPSLAPGPVWAATGSMIEGRVYFTTTVLPNGKVLVAGGFSNGDGSRPLASAELYDPSSGSWSATGKMHQARAGHTATLLSDGTVLVAGGGSSPSDTLRSAELYDPQTGLWSATGAMIEARASHTATRLADGDVLVAGGGAGASSSGIWRPPSCITQASAPGQPRARWAMRGRCIRRRCWLMARCSRSAARVLATPHWHRPNCMTRPPGPGRIPGR